MTRLELKVVAKLVFAQMRIRPGRVLLASLSTIAAACIVVWVVSGYDSLVGQFGGMGGEYVGRYELLLLPIRGEVADLNAEGGGQVGRNNFQLSKDLLKAIQLDPDVAVVNPFFETTLRVARFGERPLPKGERVPSATKGAENEMTKSSSGPIMMGGMAQLRAQSVVPIIVGTDSIEPPHTLLQGKWFDPKNAAGRDGAITREAAEYLGVQIGDEVSVIGAGSGRREIRVKISAILEQPKRLHGPKFMVGLPPTRANALSGGPATHALYVPTSVAEDVSGTSAKISYVGVALKPDVKVDEFVARWSERFASASPAVEVRTPDKVDSEVQNSTTFETVRAQAYSATGIAMLPALFIIFTTLSMGVDERIRQFAMLRAVAFRKSQIAAMVALESVLLGLIGWAGGLLAGWGLLKLMLKARPESLAEGAELGAWCIVLSGACALGGSIAASIMPIWRATSVTPLEAMVSRTPHYSMPLSWLLSLAGLVLIAVNPLVVFYLPVPDTARHAISAALGCTSMVVGFILLAPVVVVLTERLLGPVLAKLLRLNPRLLATQLSANMWRTVGTTVAMTIGLGLFVTMQVWGYSMLAPFLPGDWTPNLVVSISPSGVPDSAVDEIRHVPGVVTDKFLPLAVKQVKFAEDVTGYKVRASATRQDSCVMVGVDPDAGLGSTSSPFKFEFVEGSKDDAIVKLKRGRYCLVPDHFTRESGLGVGQKFRVIPPDCPDLPLEYEIAGVVSMPGWHWMSKIGFRRGRVAGLMFASFDRVRDDFNTGRTTTFWGNLDGSATEDEIKAAIQTIADRNLDTVQRRGQPGSATRREKQSVTLRSAESVRSEIRGRADRIIWALSELPLITLLVASIGTINTTISSIRARRWELGVLRALGVTRFGLFRLIVAESVLIGLVACALSLGFGTLAGYCGTGVTRYVNIRGGQFTPLIVPWLKLAIGFGMALSLCFLASLWPAFRTGRVEPLCLLQAGRAAR